MKQPHRYFAYLLLLVLAISALAGTQSATAQENGTTVYEEDFTSDPGYTIALSNNLVI